MLTVEEIKELKASDILQAMVDGLLDNSKDDKFSVDMGTFGDVRAGGFCFGCAANAALSNLSGQLYSSLVSESDSSYSPITKIFPPYSNDYMSDLESAIDEARQGNVFTLIYFMTNADFWDESDSSTYNDSWFSWDNLFSLETDDWESQIHAVLEVISEMKASGL